MGAPRAVLWSVAAQLSSADIDNLAAFVEALD